MNSFSPSKNLRLFIILATLSVLLIAAVLILASVPPISRDALTHHLFIPKLYIEHGGIYEIPNISFSYYPMNLDLLYMIPLYFGNDIIPKYIHFFFALLTAVLIFNYLKNRINKIYALLGSLFFLSIPIIVKLSITVYVDLGLMFFTTASLLLIFQWLNSGYKLRYLFFAGICCGLATGTKYNGLINIFLLPLFIPVLYLRSQIVVQGSNTKSIGFAILFVLAILLAFSPWLIRNYAWTGNPIYPLHNSLFQQTHDKATAQQQPQQDNPTEILKKITSRGSGVFASRKILYHETWWQSLLLPVRFFFEGQDDNPRYFDGRLNPFLLLLPFFAFFKKSPTRSLQLEKYTLLAFSLCFFFFTFFQESLRIRYIVCIVPPLVLLSIFGLQNIFSTISKIQSVWLHRSAILLRLMVLTAMFSYNAHYIVQQFQTIQPLSYIRGTTTREQYITRFRPEYQVIQYANEHLDRDSTVLCVFLGNRGYYMNFNPIFDMPFNNGILKDILTSPPPNDSIKIGLIGQGITHILLRDDLTLNWYKQLAASEQAEVNSFFQNNVEKLITSGGYSFYSIVENSKEGDATY